MGLLKFGLCVVFSISCVSKISGYSSKSLLHTELECSEEDGVLQSGPCIQCICVQQKIVCVKVVCGLEDDDDFGSVAGTDSIAMYQIVRPPEIIVKLPNSPIVNTINKQPFQDKLQDEDFPDKVVAVSIMSSDDDFQADGLELPIRNQPHIPSVYQKERNILHDLLADNTPNDSTSLTENRVEDVLKTLLTSNKDNKNDKYLLIVPEDFQSNDDEFEKHLPHEVMWPDILNNNFKTQPSHQNKVGNKPLLIVNKNKKGHSSPITAVDGYGRTVVIPLARQPYVFARPGDKKVSMRPRHYMRNDDSPYSNKDLLYSNKFKSFKYPWFNQKPVNNVPAKELDPDYWYDSLQIDPKPNYNSQYESEGHTWPFTEEKLKDDFKISNKFKYPWFNHKPGNINVPADQSDSNYYKLLQQYGDEADLSSYYKKETPDNGLHTIDQSYLYNNLNTDYYDHYNSNGNADRYDGFSNQYNKYEKADNNQNLMVNEINFNISNDQPYIRPSTFGNNQAIYQEFNSSYPKTFEGMKQIPISYQLHGLNLNGNPGVLDQNKYVNNLLLLNNNQPNIHDAYANNNQTAMTDQLEWQDANSYSEILSNKQPKQALEFDENDLFGIGNNQQIFDFLQQKNDTSHDSKYASNQFSKISQSLQNGPLVSIPAIMPSQTQSGSTINKSNEQMFLPNEFQLEQNDNTYFGALNNKHPDNYQLTYKLPAKNILQTFGNKKQVNYSSNNSQYTSNNFSKILFGPENMPIIAISETLPSDIQDAKLESANSMTNENKKEVTKKMKWLQDHDYLFNNNKPVLQSSSSVSTYKLEPGKLDYLSTNSGSPKKQQHLLPEQLVWEYENNYPSMLNYKDPEPVDDYDEYGVLASGNAQILSNKPKVKNSKYHKQNWPFINQPNSKKIKLSNQQKSTIEHHDKNRQPCGPDENCGYKSWSLGKKIRPVPLSFLLGDSTNLQIPNNEQDSAIKYDDGNGNLFITVQFTNSGIPDFENQDNLLYNQNETNYVVISYPNIDNYTQIFDIEPTKNKKPWEDENNTNRYPDISFTALNNIPAPYYNIPDDKKYEFSQLNSVVPKEPVLLPYLSKSKEHKHNYYPKLHKNIVNYKSKHPVKNIQFNLQDVISDKYYNIIPSENKPNIDKLQFLDKNITPKFTDNVPSDKVYPNKLSNYGSGMPKKYKYYQQNFLPVLQNTISSPNHNTIATLPYANQLMYNKEQVPILGSSNNINPLKLFTKPNYYPLHSGGLVSNKKVHIILPNNMPILPKVFPKQVISAQTPQFYFQNSIPKFPEKNLFSNLYEHYYPLLSSFPQVTRNTPEPTVLSDILKLLKKIANNNPLKDFLNNYIRMSENIDDYEIDEANQIFNPKQGISDYNTNFVSTVPKASYDNIQIHTDDFPGFITKPSEESNVYIKLPEESLNLPPDKNVLLPNKHPSKKIINHEHKQPKILPKFKAKNYVGSNTFNYELPNYETSDTSDNKYLEGYVNNLLPDLIRPGQNKYKNILSSDDRILPKYKKSNNLGCGVCEIFYKNYNLLEKYLKNNHQQNDIMYLVLKDIIKPLVQFVHKLILENNNFPSKITFAKPKPILLNSKDEKISMFSEPFNEKKRKNRYYFNNSKGPSFDLNSISGLFYQNDSRLPEKDLVKPRLNQYYLSPGTNNIYSKPHKTLHSTLFNKYHSKPPKAKKQQPRGIAREDKSVDSVSNQNLEDSQNYQLESHMVEVNENNIPKKSIGKIPQNENRVSFEDYFDIPIEEENSDEYSSYHRPILHKISSFESDPNRKVYLYQNPNVKFVEGPNLPKTGVNIKLYDKPYDSDEDPVLTDEFNLIPMGIPRPKQNSDEDYEVRNDDYNTKYREFYDRIRIALHNPYKHIEPIYNSKIIHNHEKKPVTDHHIVVPTLYPEQVCSLCKTLNCDRHISNNEQNNLHNLFINNDQLELSKITANVPCSDSNPTNTPLLDSNILSGLVRALILNIIAETKSYLDHKIQETQLINMQESSILSDIFSLFEYYQIINNTNRPHTIYNLFQNTLPIISSYNEIDTPFQPEYIPFQNDNNPYLDSVISNPHIMPDTRSNVVLEIINELMANKELNLEVIDNLILKKIKPCSDHFNVETNQNSNYEHSEVIPLRTMLSKFKSLYEDLKAISNEFLKIQQSEEEPMKSIWANSKILYDKTSYLPQYINRFKPVLLRKILPTSPVRRPISNHIVNYLKNSQGDKIYNFMPIESGKSSIFGRLVKPKTNKKLNLNNIYKIIKHTWEAYLSSDEDEFDNAKYLKPKAKEHFNAKPKNYKDETDLLLGSEKFPFWQGTAYSDIKPIRGTNKSNPFISKNHKKKNFDYVKAFKGLNKYPKPVTYKNSGEKYNVMPYDLDAKLWELNPKHDINEKPVDFLNKRPYTEPFKGSKFKNVESSNRWQKPNEGQFSFPKHNFKPKNRQIKYDDTEVFNDSGRPFKGHKYPAIESLKHAWKISNVLSGQEPSTSPKYLKPRGIKEEPNNISSNNHDLKPSLNDELFHSWQKQNKLSDEDKYSFPNDLMPKETQYPDLESIKNKRNPEMVLSKIRPFSHKYKDPTKYSWHKSIKPSGLSEIPFSKSNKYKNIPNEFLLNDSFESFEHANTESTRHDWIKPDILPNLGQLSLKENLKPTNKQIKYPDTEQVSGEFYNKDLGKKLWEEPDGPPDFSSENLKPNDNIKKYTSLKPIKYTDLLDEISNYAKFNSHEEIDLNPLKHIFQSPDTAFVKGPLPYTKYLTPQDNVNEYANEEAIKGKETADMLFDQNSDYVNHFKGRKLADLETEDKSLENSKISPDQDNSFQSEQLNSDSIDWTAADSNENFWQKMDVAKDNDHFEYSKPTVSEINLSSTQYPLLYKRENNVDPNSDIAATLDYTDQKPAPTETNKNVYEPILEIDSKGRNARWVDVTDFNIQRVSPNAVKYEYVEAPLIEDDSDLT